MRHLTLGIGVALASLAMGLGGCASSNHGHADLEARNASLAQSQANLSRTQGQQGNRISTLEGQVDVMKEQLACNCGAHKGEHHSHGETVGGVTHSGDCAFVKTYNEYVNEQTMTIRITPEMLVGNMLRFTHPDTGEVCEVNAKSVGWTGEAMDLDITSINTNKVTLKVEIVQ